MSAERSILGAVREEVQRTRHRLEQLEQIERLAIELVGDLVVDAAASAAGSRKRRDRAAPPRARAKTPRRGLTVDEVLDGIRDALQDGPKTIQGLHTALDISRTTRTGEVVEKALTQLGASEAGKHRGGSCTC